ncbi:MAG: macro domain-containing protein [Polyangiaceae bacterium]|nr:macro domain-containing protein [Polyangiaceae bacterium]
MRIVNGDLLKLALAGEFDVIVHGANCQGTMGAGIAKAIRESFPEAFDADLATPKGDRSKLGTISVASVTRGSRRFSVVNAYTQFDYRGRGVRVDYDAVRHAFAAIKQQFSGRRIGYPKIGAGLARGDWKILAQILDDELVGEDHTLVEYSP